MVTGGAGNDTFTFEDTGNISSGAAVSLDGGADTDTLDFQLYDDVQSITFAGGVGVVDRDGGGTPEVLTGTAANEFINIETIDGNDGSFFGPNQPNTWLIDARNGPNSGVLNEGTPDEVEFNNFTLIGGDDTDDFILASAGSIRDLITGGLGFNTLTTNNGADALITITGARAGTHSDVNNVDVDGFDFIEIDNVSGGNANDTFDVNVSFAGSISGQGGVNIFNLTQAVGGTVDGGGGGDIFNITNGQLIGTLTGGAGTDTIVGGSVANVWDVTADNAGSLNPGTANEQTFTSIESWTGNTLVDSFVFQGDFIIGGTLDGAGGTDLLDLSIYTTQTDATLTAAGGTDGFAGTVVTDGPTTVTGFDNMNSILGGAALPDQNELTGSNTVNDWQITGSGTVSTNGKLIAFGNFEELLLGGSDVDTFTLAVVLPVPAAALIIDGGGDSDVLIGLAGTNVWDITDAESGTVTNDGGVHDHMFSSIENLTGNGLVDDFLLSIDGFISGTIDAGAGVDILTGRDAPGAGTSWAVNADGAGSSDDIGAFLNVENLEGGSLVDTFSLTASGRMNSIDGGTGFDELIGDNESNTWTILVAGDSGSVVNPSDGTTNFVSIENLTGNAGLDVFSFADGGFLSGALDGGGGVADDISFANQTGAVDVTVGAVGGGIVGGGISNIESVTGNGGQSTLFGANTANTWTVDGGLPVAPNRGNVNGTLSFVDFNNLVGGSAVDTFHVTVAVDGSIDGGGGNDIFNLSAGTPDLDGGVGAADRVNITGSFSHNGVLAFEDVEIFDNTLNNTISTAGAGNGISIDGLGDDGNGTTQIGTAANPILTTISNLQITGATSGAFFTESTGVVLQGIDLGGGNTFNLTTTTGSITADSGIIDANTLVLNSAARIGFFSNPVDTTASVLNLTVGSGQGGFVESTSALDTDDIQLTGNGVPGQTFLVGGDSLTFDTTDLTLPVGTPLVTGLDVAGFSTINQIDVTNSSITTGGVDLQLVAGTDLNLQPGTTFNLGGGILGLGGNTTGNSAGDVLTVNAAGMNILGDTIFRFDTVNLNLPPNSIGGFSDVTFVPFALGTNVDVGGGTLLDAQNVAAFNGFNGGLNIGGVVDPVGAAADLSPGIAGDVVVTEPVTLGFGSVLTIAALGDLVVGEVLTAEQINLIALGDDGTASNGGTAPGTIGACGGCILDVGSTDVVITDSAVLVATNTIGTEENNLNVDIDNTLDFASGQDDISATLNDQFVTFSGTNLGPESSAIVATFQLAFSNLGVGFSVFQTDLSAIFTPPGLGTGLEVRDESLFSTDASAFGTDFLIFDPGEGAKTPFDQDPELPSQDDFPFDLDNDIVWNEFYRGNVLEFVKARWLGDETLRAFVNETFGLDLGPEGGATFEDVVNLRNLLADKVDPTPREEELRRILDAFVGEYPEVVTHFTEARARLQQEALAAKDLEPLDLPGDGNLDDGLDLPDDGPDPVEESLDPTDDGLDLPTGEDGLPALPLESSTESERFLDRFASLRMIGQSWDDGGLGIEDSWTGRVPSVFPIEMPARLNRRES